jgi:CBS domain-containing protein
LSGPTTVLAPHEPLRRAIDVTLRRPSANFAVFEGGRLVGVLTRADVANAFRRYGPDVAVARVMRTEFPVAQAGDSLLDLERRMRRSGSPLVSLVEGGRFLGLVTLESVRRALRLSPVR